MIVYRALQYLYGSLMVDSRPLMVDSRPLTVDSRPLTMDSRPLTVVCRSLTMDSRPLTVDSRPLTVVCRSLTMDSRLLMVVCRSLTMDSRPLMVDSRSSEITSIRPSDVRGNVRNLFVTNLLENDPSKSMRGMVLQKSLFQLIIDSTAKRSFSHRGYRVIEFFLCMLITL